MILHLRSVTRLPFAVALICLLGWTVQAGAHAGHEHEADEPSISLPEVVAKVNGEDISRDDVWKALTSSVRKYKKRGMPLSGDQEKIAARKLIDNEIGRRLLLAKARKLKINITPDQIETRLNGIKRGFKSEKAFMHKLEDEGLTLDRYKKELEEELMMDEALLREVGSDIKISAPDIKSFYEKNQNRYSSPEQRRASVMLIKVKEGADAAEENQAKQQLLDILEQFKGGKDFATLAKMNSQDTLKSRGGDLGFFERNKMFPPFSERAFKLKVGEVSEIFRTRHGFQILQLTDITPARSQSLEEVQEEIRDELLRKEIKKRTPDYLAGLKKQAQIKTYF